MENTNKLAAIVRVSKITQNLAIPRLRYVQTFATYVDSQIFCLVAVLVPLAPWMLKLANDKFLTKCLGISVVFYVTCILLFSKSWIRFSKLFTLQLIRTTQKFKVALMKSFGT